MSDWFASGRPIDLILGIVVLEAVGLLVWRARTGRGLAPIDVFGQLAAGACLLLALRCAVTGARIEWTALFTALSGPAHLFDMWRRVRRQR